MMIVVICCHHLFDRIALFVVFFREAFCILHCVIRNLSKRLLELCLAEIMCFSVDDDSVKFGLETVIRDKDAAMAKNPLLNMIRNPTSAYHVILGNSIRRLSRVGTQDEKYAKNSDRTCRGMQKDMWRLFES